MKGVKLHKIFLRDFVDALMEIYNKGADYIDIIGETDKNRDVLSIEVRDEYMREQEDDDDELSDEFLNNII